MKNSVKSRIELYFKIPIDKIVNELHWRDERSLNSLAAECGESRQSLSNLIRREKLKKRGHKEAVAMTKNKGNNHWNFGNNKESSIHAKNTSERMLKNNAIKVKGAAEKRALSMSKVLKDRELPQEVEFSKILTSLGVGFEEQTPFGKYNADFFLPKFNLIIEIDSCHKWSVEKREKSKIRDLEILDSFNIKTIRINKLKIKESLFIRDILYANNVILKK